MIDLQNYIQNSYHSNCGYWDIQTRMQCDILEFLLKNFEGNILEIGAHEGYHTVQFLKIAKLYNRKVFVIDPYDGQQQGNEEVHQSFLKNTNQFDNLVFLRKMSQSAEAEKLISENKFIYVFIDGLHTTEAVSSDLKLSIDSLLSNGVICIDDTETQGFNDILRKIVTEYDDFVLVKKPIEFEETSDISERVEERLQKTGHNSYGIFNPGHKEIEFIIKK